MVHPFDDPDVIAGQGTVGLELCQEHADLDTVVAPIGGGGLLAGLALAIKSRAPGVRLIGVQAEGAAPTARAFHTGCPERTEHPHTIADGIRVGTTGARTLPVIRELVDDCVTVSEEEIVDAVVQTIEKSKVVAETAAVVGIAALMARKVMPARAGGKVCAIVSGGNIDTNLLARILEAGLASAGRYLPLFVRLPDAPGELRGVLDEVAAQRGNVLDVQHYRAGWRVPLGSVDVEILVETRHVEHGREVRAALAAAGYDVRGAR
jgi:threonine dehydratase